MLAGKEDIKIEYVGLREGEKLHEELLIDENDKETKYSSIFIAKPEKTDYKNISTKIAQLLVTENKIKILQDIIPEFKHKRDN